MPPVHICRGFLDAEAHQRILAFALASEESFAASAVYDGHQPAIRASRALAGSAAGWQEPFLERVRAALPSFFPALGTKPFKPYFEVQMAAHNDGDYYKPHIDTVTGAGGDYVRALSGVYYFHREPRAFSGGALRLYRLGSVGSAEEDVLDVEPEQNSLVLFPSWAKHEVRPIRCPSAAFEDSRFSINCWILARVKPEA